MIWANSLNQQHGLHTRAMYDQNLPIRCNWLQIILIIAGLLFTLVATLQSVFFRRKQQTSSFIHRKKVSNVSREILSPPLEYEDEGLDVPFNNTREAFATLKKLFKTHFERYALIDRKFWAVRNFATPKVPILSERQVKLASDLRDVGGARL